MLFLKYLLLSAGIAMFVIAAGILTYDLYLLVAYRRSRLAPAGEATPVPLPPPDVRSQCAPINARPRPHLCD